MIKLNRLISHNHANLWAGKNVLNSKVTNNKRWQNLSFYAFEINIILLLKFSLFLCVLYLLIFKTSLITRYESLFILVIQ